MTNRIRAILLGGILMGVALLLWARGGQAQSQTAQTPQTLQTTGTGTISGTVTANRDYALSDASGNHRIAGLEAAALPLAALISGKVFMG